MKVWRASSGPRRRKKVAAHSRSISARCLRLPQLTPSRRRGNRKDTTMIHARAGLLALPLTLALSMGAQASTVSLVPLQPSSHSQLASLGASCGNPNAPAQAAARLVDYPEGALNASAQGVTQIGIELSPSGHLVRSWLLQSS